MTTVTAAPPHPKPFQFHQSGASNRDELPTSTTNFSHIVTEWRKTQGAKAKEVIHSKVRKQSEVITTHHASIADNNSKMRGDEGNEGNEGNEGDGGDGGGSLSLFARVRPVLPDIMNESAAPPSWETLTCVTPYLYLHSAELRLGLPTGRMLSTPQRFSRTFSPETTEDEVYDHSVRSLVDDALKKGKKCLVLAFGQTGSGKTHTMISAMERAIRHMFSGADGDKMMLTVQYFEIRGSHVLDLLSDRNECILRTDGAGDIHVTGVRSVPCASWEETQGVLQSGMSLRRTKATSSNSQSSRSHAIAVFDLPSSGGRVTMVDLAGSEKGKDADTHTSDLITELQEINWSLGTLKACIRSVYRKEVLGKSGEHVNYRSSKLTLFLRDLFAPSGTKAERDESSMSTSHPTKSTTKTLPLPPPPPPPTSSKHRRPKTSFIACFAPLNHHQLHSISTAKYCKALAHIGAVREGSRLATQEEMQEDLLLFYLDVAPERAIMSGIVTVLENFRGRERKLHDGIKKKYGRAPSSLLKAPRPSGSQKSPLEWTRQETKRWVGTILKKFRVSDQPTLPPAFNNVMGGGDPSLPVQLSPDEEMDCLSTVPTKFPVTGNQMYSFSVHDIVRRCGGGSSCAAFNSKSHTMFDEKEEEGPTEEELLEEKRKERRTRTYMSLIGRYVFEEFRKAVKKDKSRR